MKLLLTLPLTLAASDGLRGSARLRSNGYKATAGLTAAVSDTLAVAWDGETAGRAAHAVRD